MRPGTRQIGIWTCTALVVGNMIGSGIFLLPSSLSRFGALSLLGWTLTAVGAICVGLVLAKLAAMLPKSGGPYAYTRAAYGDFAGFWVGWGYWIAIWSGNGAIAVAFASYLGVFVPYLQTHLWATGVIAVAAVWLLTAVNCMGIREAGAVQVATTVLKVVPLIAIGTIGLLWIEPARFTPLNPSGQPLLPALSGVAALTLWAFLGLESATVPAANVIDPERTIPRATIFGVIVTAVIYILSTAAIIGAMPREALQNSGAPFAEAARSMWGGWAYYAVGAGAVISAFGTLNGWMLLAGQVPMAAADDALFPRVFGRRNRNGVPANAMIISAVLITIILALNYSGSSGLVETFNFIILLATLSSLIPYAFCSIAPLILRREKPTARQLLLPGAAFFYSLWAIWGSGAETVLYGVILLLLGIPVYARLRHEQREHEAGDA
jgi:APA family basic amino acid/polyamine antiporter